MVRAFDREMSHKYLFWLLLISICVYAFARGRSDERFAASVCLFASLATALVIGPLDERYATVENGVFLVDLATLGAFVLLALRSHRFWPLWIAGLQLTTSMAHFFKAVEIGLMPQAYATAERFWAYPILLILVVGTWRAHRSALQSVDG